MCWRSRTRACRTLSRRWSRRCSATASGVVFIVASATDEDQPISLFLDSPYQISKIIGEYYAGTEGNCFVYADSPAWLAQPRIASAVKLLVIESMRKRVSAGVDDEMRVRITGVRSVVP